MQLYSKRLLSLRQINNTFTIRCLQIYFNLYIWSLSGAGRGGYHLKCLTCMYMIPESLYQKQVLIFNIFQSNLRGFLPATDPCFQMKNSSIMTRKWKNEYVNTVHMVSVCLYKAGELRGPTVLHVKQFWRALVETHAPVFCAKW